jgi:hypothetical protein
MGHTKEKETMRYDFDDVNAILSALADADIVEPMVEPIDDPSLEVNFWDWADVVGAVDEFVPDEYTV